MKRYIKSKVNVSEPIEICITMNISSQSDSVAAADYIPEPKSIGKKRKISEAHRRMLNDIVASFHANIEVAGFPIIDEHWPPKSYSYYITFVPITDDGVELLPVKLVFRVSNHSNYAADKSSQSDFVQVVSFTLEKESFSRTTELIYEGIRILKELKKGNVGILDEIRE